MVRLARKYAWRVVFAVILTTSPATAASSTAGNAVPGSLETGSTSTPVASAGTVVPALD
jgi:hypothetical protein